MVSYSDMQDIVVDTRLISPLLIAPVRVRGKLENVIERYADVGRVGALHAHEVGVEDAKDSLVTDY